MTAAQLMLLLLAAAVIVAVVIVMAVSLGHARHHDDSGGGSSPCLLVATPLAPEPAAAAAPASLPAPAAVVEAPMSSSVPPPAAPAPPPPPPHVEAAAAAAPSAPRVARLRVPCPDSTVPASQTLTRAANKKALIIADNYTGTENELGGCIQDGINVADVLRQLGWEQIEILHDTAHTPTARPTKASIKAAFDRLVASAKAGDTIYIHDSGHGGTLRDPADGVDGVDDTIVPLDFNTAGQITDKELRAQLFAAFPAGVTVFAVFDCCHSGHVGDLRYNYVDATFRAAPLHVKTVPLPLPPPPAAGTAAVNTVTGGGNPQVPATVGARDVAYQVMHMAPHSAVTHLAARRAHAAQAAQDTHALVARHADIGQRVAAAAALFHEEGEAAMWAADGVVHERRSQRPAPQVTGGGAPPTTSPGAPTPAAGGEPVPDTAANVFVLSGCRSNQTSADAQIGAQDQGAATYAFLHVLACSGLYPHASNDLSLRLLVKNMRATLALAGFTQVPQLTTGRAVNLDRVTVKQVLAVP